MGFLNNLTDFFTAGEVGWNFCGWIISQTIFDHFFSNKNLGFTVVKVQYGADIHVFITIFLAPGSCNGSFNNIKDGLFWKSFFLSDHLNH